VRGGIWRASSLYRTLDNVIAGVALTSTTVTE
jgi:hypothetical protein